MEERTAITRLKRGDLAGLGYLVSRYQVRAVHTAVLIVHDRELAEDIVQASFVRVAEKIGQFDESRAFSPWFLRIVVNAAIKAARHQKRLLSLEDESDAGALALAGWLTDPRPDPERLVELKQTRQAVWAALDRLDPEQRAVVVMRYYLEMSEAEMVSGLRRPLSTIKWWLRAARVRLREILSSKELVEDREGGAHDG